MDHYPAELYTHRDMQNTDLLAFRFVAESGILRVRTVLDLGCGAGRSTRFLKGLGNSAIGIDRDANMIAEARRHDATGDYRVVPRGSVFPMDDASFSAVFSSWMILEEGEEAEIIRILKECRRVLEADGDAIIVTNTPEFYGSRWLSCRVDHPENALPLRSGQRVKATLLPEGVEVSDFFWSDSDYRRFFATAGFRVQDTHYPIGRKNDPLPWRNELTIAPYVIYHLQPS